jgi:class 3 adenylate cyclase/tetratricopeptide (TPR) repeat protein
VICANCGGENTADARFCNDCGTALTAGCPSCGAVNRPGARFCNECGTALASPAAGTAALRTGPQKADESPVAERRLVTVLFADLVGFTPFAEERDAEEVRETLSRYFDLCSSTVGRYGGAVEKFIGDAVMAVWGASLAHEDDAERAVRAALDLIDAVRVLGPGVEARAGVLTGEAAVTVGATNQGMVAGDLVNTAARLQSVAPAGSVLVGEATYRATTDAIAFEEAGEHVLKGKQSPVPAWRALRVVAERGGRNRSEGLEAPFVGRNDELRLLKDLFHATGREQRARLVSVMGPGGIGKSRLAWEFLKYADGLVEEAYGHSGRSPAYGEGITFWALGEMVRGRCGLVEGDDEATTRQKVKATLDEWITDDEERGWIEPALLTLLGVESGMASDQLFGAWRTFFERIAERGTVLLVFEDCHHADSGLLDFIDHLLEWSRGAPIYIVTLARPELLERRPDWGAGKRSFASIYLEPLPEAEMRELLAGLVPGLPDAAVAAIVERADGIPLYAIETVRMLVAEGRLKLEGGIYVPVGDLTDLAVPATLTALISSRLDGLDAVDRSLIHDAAVLGQSFSVGALAALAGKPAEGVEQRLRGLVKRELLGLEVDPRSAERGQYVFVQALIREVAYNTLSKKDRKLRHLAAARHFEQLGSDELASALAGHYLAAYHNAPAGPEADALAAQARVALKAAVGRAAALGAHDQVVSFVEQALTVTDDPVEQAELLETAAQSASVAVRVERAEDLFRRAIELHTQIGDRVGTARATGAFGWHLLNARSDQAALAVLSGALAEYGDLWPDPVIVLLKIQLARAYLQAEDHGRALALTDEALAAAEHADLLPIIARALLSKGVALGSTGRLREAHALIEAGEKLARDSGLTETLLGALVVSGYQLGEIDHEAAYQKYREGLELARRVGHRAMALQFANNIGYTGFLAGEWSEALAALEAALTDDLDPASRVWLMSNALIIRASLGEPIDDGLAEMDRLVESHGDPNLVFPTLDTRANAALAAGRLAEARANWHQLGHASSHAPSAFYQAARPALWASDVAAYREDAAAVDATGFHGRVVEARRATLSAGLAALEGRHGEAVGLYRAALAAWRELHVTWEEALTGIDMVSVLDPSQPEVSAAGASTREILVRLGAQPYLERLEAALSRSPVSAPAAAAEPVSAAGERLPTSS